MTYFCLDMARRNWQFTTTTRSFKMVFAAWIAVPALVAPFWQLPALLKAILAMVGNLADGAHRGRRDYLLRQPAQSGRVQGQRRPHAVLRLTLLFALALVVNGVRGLL